MSAADGGAAFPVTVYFDEKPVEQMDGMSLRDWFAGRALPAVIAIAYCQTSAK